MMGMGIRQQKPRFNPGLFKSSLKQSYNGFSLLNYQ